MRKWLRELKAVLVLSAIGGVVGMLLGGAWGMAVGLWNGFGVVPAAVAVWAIVSSLFGVVTAGGFAVLLTSLDARRSIQDLSWVRVALWGALAGASFPFVVVFTVNRTLVPIHWGGPELVMTAVCAGLGGIMSTGLVAVAKRVDRRELSDGPGGVTLLE